MREILFRGKSADYGKWVEGDLIHNWIEGLEEETRIAMFDFDYNKGTEINGEAIYNVYPDTVGQYTGLTDKNGVKIFEGDIFKFNDEVWESYYTACGTEYDSYEVKNYGVVGFDEDRSCFDFVQYKFNENSVEADLHENYDIEFADFISELEVIGNIYDNPELLKGE